MGMKRSSGYRWLRSMRKSCRGDSACSTNTANLGWKASTWRTISEPILPAAPVISTTWFVRIDDTLSVLICIVGRSNKSSTRMDSICPIFDRLSQLLSSTLSHSLKAGAVRIWILFLRKISKSSAGRICFILIGETMISCTSFSCIICTRSLLMG